jgi:hypothetical protein
MLPPPTVTLRFAPQPDALEYGGVCNLEHSGDGPNAEPLLRQNTHSCVKFLAKCSGISAQVLDGFGFQKWGKFTPRR